MSEEYWYPFYPTLFGNDTKHLSLIERGMYRDLIDHYMTTGKPILASDNEILAICRVPYDANPVLMQCYVDACSIIRALFEQCENGFLTHKRCDEELATQRQKKKQRKDKATKAANKRWENQGDNAPSMPQALPEDATNTNTNTDIDIKEDTNVSSKKPKMAKVTLDELSVDHINDWLAEKRGRGRYLYHDEHHVLEVFKDYCRSKGKTYKDYVAGLRNAFDWDRFNNKQNGSVQNGKPSDLEQTIAAIDALPL